MAASRRSKPADKVRLGLCAEHANELALDGWAALRRDLDDEPGRLNPTRREHCVPLIVDEWPMLRLALNEERYTRDVIDRAAGVLDQSLYVLEDELNLSLNFRGCAPGFRIARRNYRRDNQVAEPNA